MAFTINCCINQFQPLPTTTTTCSISKPSDQVMGLPQVERSWKTQRVLGMACTIIIGFQTANLVVADQSMALVMGMMPHEQGHEYEYVDLKAKGVERWSEKRTCQPWHMNSLETIVPENLPRLETRRKWQSIHHSSAPNQVVIKVLNPSKGCFSL